ncbi:MAG: SUMF1/EgtB/PvdO family nonheme iron enzyme, partial [Oligoflexales bacterium]|nr:SUMF1/EgtB/PvdO family nonheme iron enzyme [Oligoflexales bacterium]
MTKIREIFSNNPVIGQGNPDVTVHPMTRDECREKLKLKSVSYENPDFERICGAKYMAPLYNPAKEKPEQAKACIDQFEFPSVPCDYPVVWVKAKEAEEICQVLGKRMCDAHEWEGACAGSLEEPDYRFDLAKGIPPHAGFNRMRDAHNKKHSPTKAWSYGPEFKKGVCAQNSKKANDCNGGNWQHCGSNTYPSGSFPDCRSGLQVYDLNGNAAEHMNLPLNESQMTSKGSRTLGQTEMKGSWFIWDKFQAHPDWCRWRAPYWHGSAVMIDHSHNNYHLGFRCCKTLK